MHALADDIDRHLGDRPVLAQPDRRWYRLTKFVSRNRLAVATAAAISLAVISGAAVAVWQARVALAEKERAEEVKEFITSIFEDADPYLKSGDGLSAIDLLKQAKTKIDGAPALTPELRVELLNMVGSSLTSLEDFDAAEVVLKQAVATAGRSLDARHAESLRARILMAQIHRYRGRTSEARSELNEVVPLLRATADTKDLVVGLDSQAMLSIDEGKYEDAISSAREAVQLSDAKLGERHPDTAASAIILALAYVAAKKPELALETAELAQRRAIAAHGTKHPRIIEATSVYGRALSRSRGPGSRDRAARARRRRRGRRIRSLEHAGRNFCAEPRRPAARVRPDRESDREQRQGLRNHRESFGAGILQLRRCAECARRGAPGRTQGSEALPALSDALETFKTVLGPTHPQASKSQMNRALALAYLGRLGEAQQAIEPMVSSQRAAADASLSKTLYVAGFIRRLAADPAAALPLQQESFELSRANPKAKLDQARALTEMGLNQVEAGHFDEATPNLEKALALFEEAQPQITPQRADALVGLGRASLGRGRAAEARPFLEAADTFWHEFDADNRWAGEAALWLGRCNRALGRQGEATEALGRAAEILSRSPIPSDVALVRLARQSE